MKKIIINSHVFKDAPTQICDNGDVYDSELILLDDNEKVLFHSKKVNVDSSRKILPAVIELEKGVYCGIVGIHNNRIQGIFICRFKYLKDLQAAGDWKVLLNNNFISKHPGIRYLPAVNPNPKWDNDKAVNACNLHDGGQSYDYSEGCITVYYEDYPKMIPQLKLNEVLIIEKN